MTPRRPSSDGRRLLVGRASALLRSRHAGAWLFVLSLAEATVVPIPLEVVLIPYMATNRGRIWRLAGITLAGCLAGALLGYGVGRALFTSAGTWAVGAFGWEHAYASFQGLFTRHGFWAIVLVGIVPIPFQVAMLAAGVARYSIALFVLATLLARGVRYYGVAWLVAAYGERAKRHWERHVVATSVVAAGVVVLVAVATQWMARAVM